MSVTGTEIYAATYSNVPVYEFNCDGNHVMRRRHDDFINATHILKVADYDKPARTRILEREVQKGLHEKIQGGYGKYQGTWIPLEAGRMLAERNNVFDKLKPIFEYVPGNVSPPPAPKHTTNPARPRPAKPLRKAVIPRYNAAEMDSSNVFPDDATSQGGETIDSTFMDEDTAAAAFGPYAPGSSRKRKRQYDMAEQQHMLYADALLDYFIISSGEGPSLHPVMAPSMPLNFQVDRPIDDQWHTALHWAVAMGDVEIVRQLVVDRKANISARNQRGETPLIRAVLFTNNFEKDTMQTIVRLLSQTIAECDHHGASVLHHVVMTTNSRARRKCAQFYLSVLLDEAKQHWQEVTGLKQFINAQDKDGDTALHIAIRHGAKKCIRALRDCDADEAITNSRGESAQTMLAALEDSQPGVTADNSGNMNNATSSSPPPDAGTDGRATAEPLLKQARLSRTRSYQTDAARSFNNLFETTIHDKGMQVAVALENEIRDKDELLQHSQEALVKVEQERKRINGLMNSASAAGNSEPAIDPEILQLQADYASQKAVALSFAEQEQHRQLHQSIRESEALLPASAHQVRPTQMEGEVSASTLEQIDAARDLASEQDRRKQLTNDVVEAESNAGMGAKGEACKDLVARTMGVDADKVDLKLVEGLAEELDVSAPGSAGEGTQVPMAV